MSLFDHDEPPVWKSACRRCDDPHLNFQKIRTIKSPVNGESGESCAVQTHSLGGANNQEPCVVLGSIPVSHSPDIKTVESRLREKGQIE